jgi:thiol-disulfide isomerase/thioredoxin
MKKIIFGGLILCCGLVLGDDSAPTSATGGTNAPSTNAPPVPVVAPGPVLGDTDAVSAQFTAKETAVEIRNDLVDIHPGADNQGAWDAVNGKLDAFEAQFGSNSMLVGMVVKLRKIQLTQAQKTASPESFAALVQKLQTDPAPAVVEMAKAEQVRLDRVANLQKQPLDLKYTALDGSTVDLAKLRGKVVLVDFWSSTCAPYAQVVPDIVAAYKKYHDQGFEVVGISLDEDKDAMQGFMQDKGMTWPQNFDGKGWNNDVSQSFNIRALPVEWLVDKKGMVVSLDARQDLDGQVAALLKAP